SFSSLRLKMIEKITGTTSFCRSEGAKRLMDIKSALKKFLFIFMMYMRQIDISREIQMCTHPPASDPQELKILVSDAIML
ncbi:hypothetical protein JW979_12570, partial [bacterium]|nr:hypothetical protein [candidate division CSSED10-310 bacterium]